MISESYFRQRWLDIVIIIIVIMLSGGVLHPNPVSYIVGNGILISLLVSGIILKSNISHRQLEWSGMVVSVVFALMLIKYVLMLFEYGEIKITPFAMKLGASIIISILLLLYFSRDVQRFRYALRLSLLAVMWHAVFSQLAWFVVKGVLINFPSESVQLLTFQYIFFYSAPRWDGTNPTFLNLLGLFFPRMQGVLWEPGNLQYYLNLLLMILLNDKSRRLLVVLTILCILLTWSTTGVVLLMLNILYFVYKNKSNKKYVMLTVLIMPVLIVGVGYNVYEKTYGGLGGSSDSRRFDTISAYNVVINNPMIGIPLDYEILLRELADNKANILIGGTYDKEVPSNTNSVAMYAMFFGVPMAVLLIVLLYKQTIYKELCVMHFVLLLLTLLAQPLGFSIFVLTIMISSVIKFRAR